MEPLVTEEMIARQPPEAQLIIRLLLAEIDRLRAEVARLSRDSSNSSKPPSSGHPHAEKPSRQAAKKAKRKAGGQPGHPRHERELVPAGQCVEVVDCRPAECRGCGGALAGDDADPLRHQVWEVPASPAFTVEYRRHRLACPCGRTTCGELPAGVPHGQAGPRLVALAAYLLAFSRQSKAKCALLLEAVFGVAASPAWVVKMQQRASEAARGPYEELKSALPAQEVAHLDESPTKEGKSKAWNWTFVARRFTVFAVRTSRKGDVAAEYMGAGFAGVVVCDRARMYWRFERLQWCWAHLKRDWQELIDRPSGRAKWLGNGLMRQTEKLFALWKRVRDGTLTRRGLRTLLKPVKDEVRNLLSIGYGCKEHRRAFKELVEGFDNLWTFAEVEGVEPTNNAAERSLRHGVIWRKTSFGTQSAAGSRFVERMLTAIETCRQQGRNAYDWLVGAVQARFSGMKAPSLLGGA